MWHCSDNHVVLAHRRLNIVAIDDGQQPIRNEDDSIVAVVNGEFYGHRKIRRQLETAGHRFNSESDSEIVVHLYRKYDLDFVDHLRGEFSFLLWDEVRKRLVAVRDRFGIKPLVFHHSTEKILFASEAKALLPELQNRDWNLSAFFQAASLQYLPQEQTLFAGIKLVPPGSMIVVEDASIRLRKYWDLDYPERAKKEREFTHDEHQLAITSI